MTIQTTTNYKLFKSITSNREIDKGHVKKLAASILRKNLLFIRPIIVNTAMEIIDGQHRLAACQQLRQPVSYVVAEGLTKDDIAILNTAQKNWTSLDFITFYALEGRKEFREFCKLANRFSEVKITALLRLASAGRPSRVREGYLNIGNISRATLVCSWLRKLRNLGYNFVYERDFTLGLNDAILDEPTFSMLLASVTADNFYKCNSRPEYEGMIRAIINQ
jgi:hypothetical protein